MDEIGRILPISRIRRTRGMLASQVLGEHVPFSNNTGYSKKVTLKLIHSAEIELKPGYRHFESSFQFSMQERLLC